MTWPRTSACRPPRVARWRAATSWKLMLDTLFPTPIVVFEDPGTVTALANGRGYAFSGLSAGAPWSGPLTSRYELADVPPEMHTTARVRNQL